MFAPGRNARTAARSGRCPIFDTALANFVPLSRHYTPRIALCVSL